MQGLWLLITTKDHPLAYDPAIGPVADSQRWNVGGVIEWREGDSTSPPGSADPKAYTANYYRWVFYAELTVDDLTSELGDTDTSKVRGGLRFINDAKPAVRSRAEFDTDVRKTDKRTTMDRILGR